METNNQGFNYNQPSGHPNIITQPDAKASLVGVKNLTKPYASPEFGDEDSALTGIMEISNRNGDKVSYSQSLVHYVDGNHIQVTAGTSESRTSRLLRNSIYHYTRAQLFGGSYGTPASTYEPADKSSSTGIKQLVPLSSEGISTEAIPISYRARSEEKLGEMYAQAAKDHAAQVAAKFQEAVKLQRQFGNEVSTAPTDPKQAFANYTPPSKVTATVNPTNYGERLSKDYKGDSTPHELLVVIHETVISADAAIAKFQSVTTERSSYHILIRRDGTIVTLLEPAARAFANGNSAFNGETFSSTEIPGTESVNNFSYNLSLETNDDPISSNPTTSGNIETAGYTEAQYKSLALAIAPTGVKPERITTHREVDLTNDRFDPRSFDMAKLKSLLATLDQTRKYNFGPGIK